MKFELKTENDHLSKPSFAFFLFSIVISLIIIISNISLKLGNISKHYEINYLCKLLIVDKTPSNFKKLSKSLNQSNKQKIWDICREIIK